MNRGVLVVAGALGCAGEVGVERGAISGGASDATSSAVVGVLVLSTGAQCTGALIAPNLVLTAQHCVADVVGVPTCDEGTFGAPRPPEDFFVTTRPTFSADPGDYHAVREVVIPTGGDGFCGRDVALVVLDDNVAAAEAAPLAPRLGEPPVAGELYSAVGYGATDDLGTGSGERRRRDGLAVACVGADCPGAVVEEWTGEAGICQGDSGGPALDADGELIGVASRGAFGCINPTYTATTTYADWLRAEGARAANLGGYTPPAWVMAEPAPADAGVTDAEPAPDAAPVAATDGGGCAVATASRARGAAWLALLATAVLFTSRRRKTPR